MSSYLHETHCRALSVGWRRKAALILTLSTFWAAPAYSSPEMDVLVNSMDKIEKRLNRLEADFQKAKKSAGGANPAAASAAAAMPAGNDSLKSALASLEQKLAGLEKALAAATQAASAPTVTAAPTVPAASTVPAKEAGAAPVALAAAVPTASVAKPAGKPKADLALAGNIQVQGERVLTTAGKRNNLDGFWGRANIGLDFKDEQLQTKLNVRIFPEGFGFDPLTSISFDTAGQGKVNSKSDPQAKVQLNTAWAKYSWNSVAVRVGRMEVHDGPSETFGYYVDGGHSGKFMSRVPVSGQNAIELDVQAAGLSSSVMLSAADNFLNKGNLRVYEKYALPNGIKAAVGYKSNVFDLWRFPDSAVLHRFDASLAYEIKKGWLIFGECAKLQVKNRREDDIPVLVGFQMPLGRLADHLSIEAEYLSTRKARKSMDPKDKTMEDKPLLVNVYAKKKVLKRVGFDFGIASDANRADPMAFGMSLRMTTTLK